MGGPFSSVIAGVDIGDVDGYHSSVSARIGSVASTVVQVEHCYEVLRREGGGLREGERPGGSRGEI